MRNWSGVAANLNSSWLNASSTDRPALGERSHVLQARRRGVGEFVDVAAAGFVHDGGVDDDRADLREVADAAVRNGGCLREVGSDVSRRGARPTTERVEAERGGCLVGRDATTCEQVEHRRGSGALVGGVAQHHGGEIEQHPVECGVEVVDVDDGNVGHVEQYRRGAAFEFVEHAPCHLGGVAGGQHALADVPAVAAVREWRGAAGERGSTGQAGFGGIATVGVERLDHQPVDGVRHEVALEALGELLRREILTASAEHLVDGGAPLLDRGRGELVGQARACRRIGHRLHRVDSTEATSGGPHPHRMRPFVLCARGDLNPHALSDTST